MYVMPLVQKIRPINELQIYIHKYIYRIYKIYIYINKYIFVSI